MKNLNFNEIEKIQNTIMKAFEDAGYSSEVMYSLLATMITEYFCIYGCSEEDLENYFDVVRENFKMFKEENDNR